MQNNNDFENEYDSLKDVTEFQNNMYNPGHYIGTGRVAPIVSAPGNTTPMVVACFVFAALLLVLGLLAFGSDVENKIALALILFVMSGLSLVFAFAYLRKAKKFYKAKRTLETEEVSEETPDEIWQRTCPKCGETHDIDYPKCPKCKHSYID